MSNSSPKGRKKRPAPLSVRLTDEERETLVQRSGGLPLSAYVKSLVFVENAPAYRKSPKPVPVDRTVIAQVLSYLGQSRLAANLNQLAKAANTGSLYFDEDTRTSLIGACNDIQAIRYLLMHALGKNVPQEIQKALLSGGAE